MNSPPPPHNHIILRFHDVILLNSEHNLLDSIKIKV